MLIGKQCKFILMRGAKFRYRSAGLQSFRLEMRLTEDDMPRRTLADVPFDQL
jgi:hypothetical protein